MIKKTNISNCDACFSEDELIKFVNSELNEAQNTAIEHHLACCEMCSDVVDSLFMMDSPDQLFAEKNILNKKINNLISGGKKRKARTSVTIRSIAAIALLLIISGTYFIADYLVPKKEITEIQTAGNENSEKTNKKEVEDTDQMRVADVESEKSLNSVMLFRSPLHDFDSDQQVVFEEELSDAIIYNDADELTIENKSLSVASITATSGANITDGGNRNPVISHEISEPEITSKETPTSKYNNTSTNQSNLRDAPKVSGESSGMLDLSDKKAEDRNAKKLQEKEYTDSEQSKAIQEPPSTTNITIVENMIIVQNSDNVILTDDLSEETIDCISFVSVEEKPMYPGGDAALLKFISENTIYPIIAKENSIQGKVFIQFIIDKEGKVANVKVAKGVDPNLDAEALRVVNMMPKWTPGKQRGVNVNVSYIIPINFYLF